MGGQCPHLGLDGDRHQVFLVSSRRHRCYVRGQPERIGAAYQAEKCLTSAWRRCPRLVARPQGAEVERAPPARDGERAPEPAARVGATERYTDLRLLRTEKRRSLRRPLRPIELIVLGLGLSIVLTSLFIGYAFVYRLRVGPGMGAGPVAAGGSELVTAEVPSPVPTASAVPTVGAVTPGPPTSIPEPTLPVPTPIARPAATSPPTRLVIPKIDLDIPVLPVGTKTLRERGKSKTVWADVPYGGGFHQTSAYPGNLGNTVINGHRDILGAVFRHLDRLEVGDEISLYVGEVAYPYLITETLIVPETFASAEQRAENLRLIGYMPEERLTLVTCTPVGLATHRLLVIAKPPDQALPQMPEAGSDTVP